MQLHTPRALKRWPKCINLLLSYSASIRLFHTMIIIAKMRFCHLLPCFQLLLRAFKVQPEVFDHDVCVVVRLNKPVRLFQMVCVDISECLRSSFSLIVFGDQSLFYVDILTAFVLAQSSFLPSLTLSRTA